MNIVKDNKDYTYWKYFIFVNNKLIQDNKKIEIKVYWQVNNNTTKKKEKIRRMRILSTVFF